MHHRDEWLLAREKITAARNQILSIYVPGDIPDLHTLHLPVMEHDLSSVGASTVAFVSHSFLADTLMKSPALMRAFWRETIIDAAIYREWVGGLGSLRSPARLAHLICELATRMEIVGLLHLLNRSELDSLAAFDPGYLHVGKYADSRA